MLRFGIRMTICSCLLLLSAAPLSAQTKPLTGGYAGRAAATVTGPELSGQTNLWVLEVDFKPPRMISVEITDAKTGKKKQEWIWYLAYRAINRPIDRRVDATDTEPTRSVSWQIAGVSPSRIRQPTLLLNKGNTKR